MVNDVSIVAGAYIMSTKMLLIAVHERNHNDYYIIPIIRGADSFPIPNMFLAVTMRVISVEG